MSERIWEWVRLRMMLADAHANANMDSVSDEAVDEYTKVGRATFRLWLAMDGDERRAASHLFREFTCDQIRQLLAESRANASD